MSSLLEMKRNLVSFLTKFVTEQRIATFYKNVEKRTRYLTVVLEDIYQSHNASAVLRSCDAFGVQDIHIVENKNRYQINPDVEMGTSKWLSLRRWKNTSSVIEHLKAQNYRIVATTPHTNDVELEEFDVSKGKIALLFGTEKEGLTQESLNAADEFLRIPMFGFVESLNISVCAAVTLHHLMWKLRGSDVSFQISDEEKLDLVLAWLRASIRNVDLVEKTFLTPTTSSS